MPLLPCKVAIFPGSGNEDVDIVGDEKASFFLPLDMNGRPMFSGCSFKCLCSAYLSQVKSTHTHPLVPKACAKGNKSPWVSSVCEDRGLVRVGKKGWGRHKLTSLFLNPTPLRLLLFIHCPQSTCNIPFHFADGKKYFWENSKSLKSLGMLQMGPLRSQFFKDKQEN